MQNLAFMVDISQHLNKLNKMLQAAKDLSLSITTPLLILLSTSASSLFLIRPDVLSSSTSGIDLLVLALLTSCSRLVKWRPKRGLGTSI